MKKAILIGLLVIIGIGLTIHLVANRHVGDEPYIPSRIEWLQVKMDAFVAGIGFAERNVLSIRLSKSEVDMNGVDVAFSWRDNAKDKDFIKDYYLKWLTLYLESLYTTKNWNANPTIYYTEEQNDAIINIKTQVVDTSTWKKYRRNQYPNFILNKSVVDDNTGKKPNEKSDSNKILTVPELASSWESIAQTEVKVLVPKSSSIEATTITCLVPGTDILAITFNFPANALDQLTNVTNKYGLLSKNIYIQGMAGKSTSGGINNVNNCIIIEP